MTQINLSFPAIGGITLSAVGIQGPSGGGGGGGAAWGGITGTLSDQTDLQAELDGKATAAQGALADTALQPGAQIPWTDVTGKPTFFSGAWGDLTGVPASFPPSAHNHPAGDITGLAGVATSGSASDLTAGTLPAARFDDTAHGARAGGTLHAAATTGAAGFMSAADKTKLDGVATGANNYAHPNHTGDVTSVGDGATTIANNAVSNAKAAQMAANTVKANATAATANQADLAVGTNTVVGRVAGNIVAAQLVDAQVAAGTLTNAKLANVATATLKGRVTAGSGAPEDLTGTQATALLDTFTSTLKGLAPASGGGTTNFLRADGTWAAPPGGGGGGSPGGTTGEIQYNSAGTFAGAADVEIEGGQLRLPAISAPAAPAGGGIKLYGKSLAGKVLPTWMEDSGAEMPVQAFIGRKAVGAYIAAGNGGTDTQWALPVTAGGTATAENITNTSVWGSIRARSWRITTAAPNAIASLRANALQWTVGGNAAGRGGFFLSWIWGPATGVATTTNRALVGMRSSVAAPTDVEPSSLLNFVGMGWDAADTNVQMMHNDGSGTATKIDLGANFPVPTADTTQVYELYLFSPPGTTQSVGYEVRNVNTAAVATGTITTDLPSTTTLLAPVGSLSAGGTSSVIGFMTSVMYIG